MNKSMKMFALVALGSLGLQATAGEASKRGGLWGGICKFINALNTEQRKKQIAEEEAIALSEKLKSKTEKDPETWQTFYRQRISEINASRSINNNAKERDFYLKLLEKFKQQRASGNIDPEFLENNKENSAFVKKTQNVPLLARLARETCEHRCSSLVDKNSKPCKLFDALARSYTEIEQTGVAKPESSLDFFIAQFECGLE